MYLLVYTRHVRQLVVSIFFFLSSVRQHQFDLIEERYSYYVSIRRRKEFQESRGKFSPAAPSTITVTSIRDTLFVNFRPVKNGRAIKSSCFSEFSFVRGVHYYTWRARTFLRILFLLLHHSRGGVSGVRRSFLIL